jgi:hypothetical protein
MSLMTSKAQAQPVGRGTRIRGEEEETMSKSLQRDNHPEADEPILFLSLHKIGHLKSHVCSLPLQNLTLGTLVFPRKML